MFTLKLSAAEESTLWSALIIAKERYKQDIEVLQASIEDNPETAATLGRVVEQFKRQIREAQAIINRLDGRGEEG